METVKRSSTRNRSELSPAEEAALTIAANCEVTRSKASSPATETLCIIKAANVYRMSGLVYYNIGYHFKLNIPYQ